MTIIEVSIHDEGEHWRKTVKLFGLTVYHRHDFTKGADKKTVGFNIMPSDPVYVDDEDYYPETRKALKELQERYVSEMTGIVMARTSAEWKESDLVQDLVAQKLLKAYTGTTKAGEEYARYFQTDPDALKAFQQRKAGGMNLSQRVWNLSEQYKTELEMALSAAIEPGASAMELAADIKKCLNEPDMMFRRFRYKDEEGNWQRKWKQKVTDADGKVHFVDADPKDYHPGRGVYRSSARNAQRLARTEINMAYRTAEQERWKSFDFVVGYEVKIIQNKEKHVEDICDCLQGKYPKTFKFTGWHPQCMCYTIPILKTEDEFFDDDEDAKSVNEVEGVPKGFADWVEKNAGRIEAAEKRGTVPYFIADNKKVVENILEGGSGNGKTQASNDKTETKDRANHEVPPHVEEYKSYSDGKIMVSPLHGKDELQSNLELGKVMYELMENTVYLLPNINPKGNNAHLRATYLPKGVKEGKNPDFLCGGRLWDGKECSFENTPKEWKKIKSTLENHFKKAKQQADNFIIKVPEWLEEQTFTAIVENYLAISKKDRWIIICKGNGYKKLYKYTIG